MTRKELFYNSLFLFLKDEGFMHKRNQFVKYLNQNEFIIGFTIWPNFAQVEPSYRIFIQEVENVKKAAWGKLYKKFSSVGNSQFIVGQKDLNECELNTSSERHVLNSVKKEIRFYNNHVKKYFLSNSSITYLDNTLNAYPGTILDINFNAVQSSFLAVIVAYLNRRENLIELIELYRNIVAKENKEYLLEFQLLTDYVLGA